MTPEADWSFAELAAYLLGAVPFGLLVGKLVRGVDLRDHGSGNHDQNWFACDWHGGTDG